MEPNPGSKPRIDRQLLLYAFRQSIRITATVVALIGTPWAAVAFYQSTSGPVRDATNSAASVLFGAVVATITLFGGQAFYDRRKKRGELLARLPALAYESTAQLVEFYNLRNADKLDPTQPLAPQAAQLARVDGALAEFELLCSHAFRGRKPRAAVHKFRRRINALKEHIASPALPPPQDLYDGIGWILEQAERAGQLAAADAGIRLHSPAGVAFVGFRRVTAQDKVDLSYEDTSPPWERRSHRKK